MVIGQAIFQEWFKGFENQYVLIGGTAASITMAEAGPVIELPEKIRANLEVFVRAVAALNRAEQMQSMRRIAEAYALRL